MCGFSLSLYIVTLRVSDHIGAVHLHQIWLYKKPCLAGAGTADDEYVLVSSVLRLLWTAVHGQELRLRQNDVVGELRVHVRFDVIRLAPSGRSVFFALPELLAVLAFDVDRQLEQRTGNQTGEQINGMKAGQRICEGSAEHGKSVCQPVDERRAGCKAEHSGDLIRKVEGKDIRKVQKNELLHIGLVHSSTPRSLVLTLTFSLCCALLWAFS